MSTNTPAGSRLQTGPPLARIVLYVKDIPAVAAFYQRHFGMKPMPGDDAGWLELSSGTGCTIALHQAARSQKSGAAMKIVFYVNDVKAFKARAARRGLKFGTVHSGSGIEYTNAKDPAGNSISVSSRLFARPA